MDLFFASSGLIAIMLCSLVYCFFGYRFFKLLLGLSGALIAASLTWFIFNKFAPEMILAATITSLIMSALGAWIFQKAFKVAAFLYGCAAGLALSPALMTFIEDPLPWHHWALPAVCAVCGGLLLLISRRLIMIIMTSGSGAIYFTMALFLLLIQHNIFEQSILDKPNNFHINMWFLSFFLCFISGITCQLRDKSTQS